MDFDPTKLARAAPMISRSDKGEEEGKDEEKKPAGDPVMSKLLESRTILLFGEINEKAARSTIAQLLALSADKPEEPIKLIISSPGGHVESGDAIHDMIRFIAAPVKVIGTGWVASAGVNIFLAAQNDMRFCTPNTRFMIHQPLGGVGGRASDIAIEAQEIIKAKKRINELIARETGQPFERIEKDTDRNFWMSPEEAKAYGLLTHIVASIRDVDG